MNLISLNFAKFGVLSLSNNVYIKLKVQVLSWIGESYSKSSNLVNYSVLNINVLSVYRRRSKLAEIEPLSRRIYLSLYQDKISKIQ
jgi:hypothetical protein